jgi:hypothetical protein
VPAAAVIPAPTAYTNIVAVKTLVVQCRVPGCGVELMCLQHVVHAFWSLHRLTQYSPNLEPIPSPSDVP